MFSLVSPRNRSKRVASAHPARVFVALGMPAPLPARKTPHVRAARHGRLRLFAAAMGLVGDEDTVSFAEGSTSLSSLQRELREDIDAREACALVVSMSTHSDTDSNVRTPRAAPAELRLRTHALHEPACSVTAARHSPVAQFRPLGGNAPPLPV